MCDSVYLVIEKTRDVDSIHKYSDKPGAKANLFAFIESRAKILYADDRFLFRYLLFTAKSI